MSDQRIHRAKPLRLGSLSGFPLYLLFNRMLRLYTPHLNQLNLTYPQFLVLTALWENDGQMVTEIGHLLRYDTGMLTPILQKMEIMGVIERRRQDSDKRKVRAFLTPQGFELYERANEVIPPIYELGKDVGVTQEEIAELRKQAMALLEKLEKLSDQTSTSRR